MEYADNVRDDERGTMYANLMFAAESLHQNGQEDAAGHLAAAARCMRNLA